MVACDGTRAVAGDDHEPAARESGIRLSVVEIRGEVLEDREPPLRERDVLGHRIVRAHDARRLRRRAATQRAALEQQHAAPAEARDAEIIVIGSPRKELTQRRRSVFGATVDRVMRNAPCRVMVTASRQRVVA